MGPPIYDNATCFICGQVHKERFHDRRTYCSWHSNAEIDFFLSLPEGQLSKEDKAQRRIYEKSWAANKGKR